MKPQMPTLACLLPRLLGEEPLRTHSLSGVGSFSVSRKFCDQVPLMKDCGSQGDYAYFQSHVSISTALLLNSETMKHIYGEVTSYDGNC